MSALLNKKRIIFLIVLAGLTVVWFAYLSPSLKVATGYASKYTCSYQFLSGIDQKNVDKALQFFPVKFANRSIDSINKKVETSFFGFIAKQTATYYEYGDYCGCVVGKSPPAVIPKEGAVKKTIRQKTDTLLWPIGNKLHDSLPASVDAPRLNQILDRFLKAYTGVYAIVVAYQNYLVGERYQAGVDQDTRILGWSMTKTIGNALFGILEHNKSIDINEVSGIAEWADDGRREITINHLLQMNSGLRWAENYSRLSDVTRMLYLRDDFTDYAQSSSKEALPGKNWVYSSGTSNILSKILRMEFEDNGQYLAFPYDSLFRRIHMNSAVLEMDKMGNYVLSSYCFATARDWTKFGLLYLYEGNWFGQQIFSPDWVKYSTTPAAGSNGVYGAQIWLNRSGEKLPGLPKDAFFENGFGGQRILIIPSKDIVITVMSGREDNFNFDELYAAILDCFEN